jgi:hypothetical protein
MKVQNNLFQVAQTQTTKGVDGTLDERFTSVIFFLTYISDVTQCVRNGNTYVPYISDVTQCVHNGNTYVLCTIHFGCNTVCS